MKKTNASIRQQLLAKCQYSETAQQEADKSIKRLHLLLKAGELPVHTIALRAEADCMIFTTQTLFIIQHGIIQSFLGKEIKGWTFPKKIGDFIIDTTVASAKSEKYARPTIHLHNDTGIALLFRSGNEGTAFTSLLTRFIFVHKKYIITS